MPLGRRRSSVSAPSSSGILDQPYVGSSGSNPIDPGTPPELQEEEDRKQAELDQQFFAPSSPVNETSAGPALPQSVKEGKKSKSGHHHHHRRRERRRSRSPSPVVTPDTGDIAAVDDDDDEEEDDHVRDEAASGVAPSEEMPTHQPSSRSNHNLPDNALPSYNSLPFDFSVLEDYAAKEREALGLTSPVPMGASGAAAATSGPTVSFSPERISELRGRRTTGAPGDDHESGIKAGRMGRARKLSESVATPGSRGGRYQRKLALFEGSGSNSNASAAADRATSSAISNNSNVAATSRTPLMAQAQNDKDYFGTMGGRPAPYHSASSHRARSAHGAEEKGASYRFSFYSNALPSTVHTKFLSELPSEGESFKDLFMGPNHAQHPPAHSAFLADHDLRSTQTSSRNSFSGPPAAGTPAAAAGPQQPGGNIGLDRLRTTHALMRPTEDFESNTWWLDVLCPTDAEMKVLSKAFGIHPLTTEDIQMEESREKIELFRNYYFVCFRSFDQDPYSPTYLEPLNMYIIVFREGTLSFHFRGAPHPGNVRRRIKQLKDFINVSSDWISYALIDDITDAFGPLIQSIEYEVDSIDELVLILKEAEQSDMLRRCRSSFSLFCISPKVTDLRFSLIFVHRIGTCRKKVMGLLRLIGQKADVVKGLAKRCNENWSVAPKSDIGLYLSDIQVCARTFFFNPLSLALMRQPQDHLVTMTQNLNHYEKILSRSHSNYLAQISIEMTGQGSTIIFLISKSTKLTVYNNQQTPTTPSTRSFLS